MLVVAGLAALAAGGAALRQRPAARGRAPAPGRRSARLRVAGLWALYSRRHLGGSFTSDLTRRPASTGSPASFCHPRARRLPGARIRLVLGSRERRRGRPTGVLSAAFLLSLIGVLCARDALSFLFFWELMTLVPAAIILAGTSTRGRPAHRLHLRRDHAPRRRRNVDRAAPARPRRRDRRRDRTRRRVPASRP